VEAVSQAYDAGATDFLAKGFTHRLLTERVRFLLREHDTHHALQVSRHRLRTVQSMARIGHWEVDHAGHTIDLSSTVADILGTDGGAAGLDVLLQAISQDDRERLEALLAAWQGSGEPFRLDCQLRSGSWVHIQGAGATTDSPDSFTLAIQDVTLLREAQHEAHRLAFYDPLSGLPNRKRFLEVLDVIVGLRQRSSPLAVIALRVRGAERVLESAGQAAADRVVVAAAGRLHDAACRPDSPGRILAHLGGGEFALVLPDCDSAAVAAQVAEALIGALRPPVEGARWSVNLVAQAGIAMWPQDEAGAEALLAEAQATAAKLATGNASAYAFFTPEVLQRARRRLDLEGALRGALQRDEFRLVYQPRVELADLHIAGMEALLRWRHPQLGEVSPGEFIEVAEEAGLLSDIGAWVLDRACSQTAAWRRKHRRGLAVSVNVSSQQLAAPRELVTTVHDALSRHGLPPGALELELTESMVINAGSDVLDSLRALRRLGVTIALDDFGTGYSSLGYLRKLPVDCLKIDRFFVSDLEDDAGAVGVLEAILAVARALRLRTVAEGIETVPQYRLLVSQGCREGQGYLFAKPLEASDFVSLLATPSLPCRPELLSGTG
jgi:predicted signal transduction protein with EAL and GGDEF domain